jgi:tRNA pseudouridine55 synthase
MDGVLLIDKPLGPTSHDVVARMRRALGERSIGHTGTLDPRATGLLPLVIGRATRLAAWLTSGDKTYDATIRLGVATTTDDAEGEPTGPETAALPDDATIQAMLEEFRGELAQVPPRHSAKKVGGTRAYTLARQEREVELAPVTMTVRQLDWIGRQGSDVQVRVSATAGFYVRALARDIGERLGCGAHLGALRRIASGSFSLEGAIPLDEAERLGRDVADHLISPAEALPHLAAVSLTERGLRRAVHGNPVAHQDLEGHHVPQPNGAAGGSGTGGPALPVRLLGPDGRLVALAHARGGALHPVVVLG